MKKNYILAVSLSLFLIFGCTTVSPLPQATMSSIELTKINHRMLKSNLVGKSYGGNLLGIFPVALPRYNEAMDQIYAQAGNLDGKKIVLANATMERNALWLILFTVRTLTVRTDIAEILDDNKMGSSIKEGNLKK
jgi:hypothetical protein